VEGRRLRERALSGGVALTGPLVEEEDEGAVEAVADVITGALKVSSPVPAAAGGCGTTAALPKLLLEGVLLCEADLGGDVRALDGVCTPLGSVTGMVGHGAFSSHSNLPAGGPTLNPTNTRFIGVAVTFGCCCDGVSDPVAEGGVV